MKDDDRRNDTDSDPGRKAPGDTKVETGSSHIPAEGSLGLLALGHVGLTEWRYARDGVPTYPADELGRDAEAAEHGEDEPVDASPDEGTDPNDE